MEREPASPPAVDSASARGGADASVRPAAPARRPPAEPRSVLRDYLEALLIAVIFATFARAFVLQAFKIPTGSMENNLLVGDHVLVNKFVYGPVDSDLERMLLPQRAVERGDVVVFKFPQEPRRDFIKRCVGLPGDTVEIVDKVLTVNGLEIDEGEYVLHADPNTYPQTPLLPDSYRQRDNFGPYTVPDDHYFCLGDNRDNSNDSRFWGPVPASFVKGRAFMIYWSFSNVPDRDAKASSLGPFERFLRVASLVSSRTRWERSFQIVR